MIRRVDTCIVVTWRLLLCGAAVMMTTSAGAQAQYNLAVGVSQIAPAAPAMDPHWSKAAAHQLLAAIEDASKEGLHSEDYAPDRLRAAMDNGEGPALDTAAQASALALAHDFYFGRLVGDNRQQWHISRPEEASGNLPSLLRTAIEREEVDDFLRGLLPQNERYKALRSALAASEDPVMRNRLRANLERWRWMPRWMGDNYLYVNVPSYQLQVVEGDTVASTYTVVVGAPDTPTPWLATEASSVVVNPWWNVPQSIVKSSGLRPGRGGYIFKASAGGWTVRQPPGPRNALGKLKINLDNDQAIYLHDTPAKAGFRKDARALSHGCIRVKGIDQLAGGLIGDGAGFEDSLAGTQTRTIELPRRWNVFLVYFTVDRTADGRIVSYGDPYGRDADLIARLDGSPLQIASN